ncbi:NUDIX domain-containing protein [bacterium]|nr:MAG: NUDIX domain-containing protein [bacterium]
MSNKISIFDKSGNIIGSEERYIVETPNSGFIRGVASLVIKTKDNYFLITKRHKSKRIYPNLWQVCAVAGTIDAGDSVEKTLVKEALEEVGLRIKFEDLKLLEKALRTSGGNDAWFFTYKCTIEEDVEKVRLHPTECFGFCFVTIDEMKTMQKAGMMTENADKLIELIETENN